MATLQKTNAAAKKQEVLDQDVLENDSDEYGLDDFESDFDDIDDTTLSFLGEEEIETVDGDSYAETLPQITLKQIQELEKKALEAAKNQDADPELMKILQQAEKSEIQAEFNAKFSDAGHQEKAMELKKIAFDLYQQAVPKVKQEETEALAAEELRVKTEADQKLSTTLGDKLAKAADKVGAVSYNFTKTDNAGLIALSVFTFGFMGALKCEDVSVNATHDKTYSVGFSNLKKYEMAVDAQGMGDKTQASEGDRGHVSGDDIKSEEYYRGLEQQGQSEARDVSDMLGQMGTALKETNPEKKKELWAQAIGDLGNWNSNTEKATVYNRAQLLFNAAIGELGEGNLKKAIADKLIPEEFSSKLGEMLDSLPADMKEALKDKDNQYFTGGATDRNWTAKKCSDFVRMAADPNYASLELFEREPDEAAAEAEKTQEAELADAESEAETETETQA